MKTDIRSRGRSRVERPHAARQPESFQRPSVAAACIVVGLFALVAAGCRRDPQLAVYLDAVNAEKRMLEDRLYELQHKYDEAQRELEQLKEGQAGGPSRRSTTRSAPRPAKPRSVDELPPPKIELPPGAGGDDDDLDLRPPSIDPGEPSKKSGQSSTSQPRRGQTVSMRSDASSSTAPHVARIMIDPAQTQGVDRDGRPGDDGLRLALLPLDADGRFVPRAAPLTVELYDEGDSTEPLAVWEYSLEETQLALHRADVGRGIRLQMKLPPEPRSHADYRIRVVWDPGGTKRLVTEQTVRLVPHAQTSARWTPRGAD